MTKKVAIVDLETLLAPVPGDDPCGLSLRYEGTYDRIREARREDDPTLPLGEWETKLKIADFATVDRLCQDALKKSKDLQIAAWLAEAWLRRFRLRGLVHGLSLVAALVERYWQGLHPELGDDADPEARVALFEWMDDFYSTRVRRMPLAEGNDASPFSLLDWELGGREEPADDDAPRPTRESLLARISLGGGGARWTALAVDARAAILAAESVERAVAAVVDKPPTLRRVRDGLAAIESLARDGARMNGEIESVAVDAGAEDEPNAAFVRAASVPEVQVGKTGAITSRADAYYRLAEASEYLMRTEPHSPVPYLVKRAVQWGNMSLAELLYEFVGNPDDLVAIQRLLGMRGREE
jgi:type VI secretion system protein ImpA